MGWAEAVRLHGIVASDPSSAVFAAMSGWQHPFSWEALALADLLDVQVAKATPKNKRLKPWHRPWVRKDDSQRRMGKAVSVDEFKKLLKRAYSQQSEEVDLTGRG